MSLSEAERSDTAKAAAALAVNGGEALDYLEGVGRGRVLERPSLPFIAVPTTAGSGSEATRNSVLRVPGLKVKRSLRSEFMVPRVAVIDPELSESCPLPVAASAVLDALTHLIEGYVSTGAQPTTDALALKGIVLAARDLPAFRVESPTWKPCPWPASGVELSLRTPALARCMVSLLRSAGASPCRMEWDAPAFLPQR